MRIQSAWTKKTQALAKNSDIIAVAEAINIPGAFDIMANILANHSSFEQRQQLESALHAANMLLPTLLQSASDAEEIKDSFERARTLAIQITDAVRRLYNNARNQEDLKRRRSKIIEEALCQRIEKYYDPGMCLADCQVEPSSGAGWNTYYKRIAGHEFDLCAWNEADIQGEAYECATRPDYLENQDCTALVTLLRAVETEYQDDGDDGVEIRFRVGLMSFDSHTVLERRIKRLARGNPQSQRDFRVLKFYGRDNIDEVTLEI